MTTSANTGNHPGTGPLGNPGLRPGQAVAYPAPAHPPAAAGVPGHWPERGSGVATSYLATPPSVSNPEGHYAGR